MKPIILSVCLLLGGCASIPEKFWEKDKNFSLSGLYAVHPTYGMTGLGYLSYESKTIDEEKLLEIRKQIEALAAAIQYLAQREAERQRIKPGFGAALP